MNICKKVHPFSFSNKGFLLLHIKNRRNILSYFAVFAYKFVVTKF
jgi:hypothetical protein